MKVYTTDKIRNVVLLGHGGAGKTTLAEAMCYLAGVTSRLGKVEDGNTVSDLPKRSRREDFRSRLLSSRSSGRIARSTFWILPDTLTS